MRAIERVEYIHLPAGAPLAPMAPTPRRVIVLIEQEVEPVWQDEISRGIVEAGCQYMMAWGQECSKWDDSVDWANLEMFDYDVPDEQFVMTTWHEDEPLHEVFFFARMCACHPTTALPTLTILDIRSESREASILALHKAESAGLLDDTFEDPKRLSFFERLKIFVRMK